ncbi:hypothetical protein DIPPA_21258 [Diplonema papillatum]|nr:hypothetical protein DIPPA_21258 [Diplonema papillatum]
MPAKGPKRKREESEETSSDEDSADSLMPQKSKQRYTDVWKDFLAYIREHHNYPRSVTTTRKPNETQYSGYIKALRRVTIDINLHVNTATGAVTVPQQ